MSAKMTLHGGPWNGRAIRDRGTVRVRMAIAGRWNGNRPATGSRTGTAIYQPTPERDRAHYVASEWDGVCAGIIETN